MDGEKRDGAMTVEDLSRLLTAQSLMRPERAVHESPYPVFRMMSKRKHCACCMKRKTYWQMEFGPFCKPTVCWSCMSDSHRALFREGY